MAIVTTLFNKAHHPVRIGEPGLIPFYFEEYLLPGVRAGQAGASLAKGMVERLKNTAGTIERTKIGLVWGKGAKGQGMPWENYLATRLPAGSRLPANFKTFDFYDARTKTAVSAKTLDTTTIAKVSNPDQIYYSLKKNIDAMLNFVQGGRIESFLHKK